MLYRAACRTSPIKKGKGLESPQQTAASSCAARRLLDKQAVPSAERKQENAPALRTSPELYTEEEKLGAAYQSPRGSRPLPRQRLLPAARGVRRSS